MALTPNELTILSSELINDPLARGYASMTNAEVVTSLRDVYDRSRIRKWMESSEVFQAINLTEFNALTDIRQRNVMSVLSFGRLNPQGREADMFVSYFGAGSATITALQAARLQNINRATEIGIPNVYEPDVATVRGS